MLRTTFTLVAILATSIPAIADDKTKPLAGAWQQTGGEMKIEFAGKDVMKLYPHGDSDVIVIVCQYSIDKEGKVKAKITELEGKAKEKAKDIVPIGLEFSFKWQAKDDAATIDDLTGEKTDSLKSRMEGKFEKK